MKTLGPGVRVWVGWIADEYCHPTLRSERFSFGQVVNFGCEKGFYLPIADAYARERLWRVRLDSGVTVLVGESILHPIDDDPAAEPREQEREHEMV